MTPETEALAERVRATWQRCSLPTPAFAFDIEAIRRRALAIRSTWRGTTLQRALAWPYKANAVREVVQVLREGFELAEVSSTYEYSLARADGFGPEAILWGGPAKSELALRTAVAARLLLKVDGLDEVGRIERLARDGLQVGAQFLVRLAHRSGGRWSRFGLTPDEAIEAIVRLRRLSSGPIGLHFHLGSRVAGIVDYVHMVETCAPIIELLLKMASASDAIPVSVGGGFSAEETGAFGVSWTTGLGLLAEALGSLAMERLRLIAEPGRAAVEPFGVLVTRVISIKSRDSQAVITVDASRLLLHGSSAESRRISYRARDGRAGFAVFVGSGCFEDDVIASPRAVVGTPEVDDLVVLLGTGAYDYATSTPWFRDPIPCFALMRDESVVPSSPRWSSSAVPE